MKQGWEIKKLGEVCNNARNIKWQDVAPSVSLPYIDLSAVDRDSSAIQEYQYVNSHNAPSRAKQIVKEGDVIFATTRPTLKRLCVITPNFNDAICSTGFCVLRPTESILTKWLFYNLKSDAYYTYIEPLQKGASYPAITDGEVRNYELPVPPLAEQERIVGILDKEFERIDALKANAEQNLQHAKDLFQAALKQELQPKEGWKISTIGKEFKTGAGGTPNKLFKEYYEGGDVPWLRSGEVCQKYIMHTEMFITCLGVDNSSAKWFPIDTVVVAMYGATAGQVGILRIPTTTNQAICGIFPNERYIPEFVYYVMLSQKTDLVAQATGNAQPNISQVKVKGAPIPLLDVVEQRKIVNRLEKLDENCKALEENYTKTIALCDDMKQTLLRKAFNGEL